MLNVGKIEEGFVLDHIQAGMAMSIYHHLQLDKLDCTVAIIKNARSDKMGKKDILKVECDVNMLDLDVLGFIDQVTGVLKLPYTVVFAPFMYMLAEIIVRTCINIRNAFKEYKEGGKES